MYDNACEVFIPENVLYRLAMRIKSPASEKFQEWVASAVAICEENDVDASDILKKYVGEAIVCIDSPC